MPRTFDEYGEIVKDLGSRSPGLTEVPHGRTHRRMGAVGDDVVGIDDTVGGKIWNWLHPAEVQKEYDLTGRTAPPVTAGDVVDTVVERTVAAGQAAKQSFMTGFRYAGYAAIGIGILYALHLAVEHEKSRRRE